MKAKRLLCSVCILLGGCLFLGLLAIIPGPHPTNCPGTIWKTSDGSVAIYIPEEGSPYTQMPRGTITVDGVEHNLVFHMSSLPGCVSVFTEEDDMVLRNGGVAKELEFWHEISISGDKYVLRVEESTYFTQGQILTLHKVG